MVDANLLPQRVFLDVTYTLQSGKNSGIERVVRSLLGEFNEAAKNPGNLSLQRETTMEFQVVFSYAGRFYPLSGDEYSRFRRLASWRHDFVGHLPKTYRKILEGISAVTRSRLLKKWMLPTSGHLGAFKLIQNIREKRCLNRVVGNISPVEATQYDLFLCPDAYWPRSTFWEAAEDARNNGAIVTVVLYDLIPVSHPQLVGEKQREAFECYLKKVIETANLVLAISRTVRDEFRQYAEAHHASSPTSPVISWFPLGANLPSTSKTVSPPTQQGSVPSQNTPIRGEILELFDQKRGDTPYVSVASFEPRKNHHFLLDTFELIWKNSPHLKLCLIGRIGWMCEGLLKRITEHPQLSKHLFVYHDLSDAELHYCYANTRGVILPSLVEGFGLPVVEALKSNRKLFVSDIPIHREVGQDDCIYFSLNDPTNLVEKISEWELTIGRGVAIDVLYAKREVADWKESFRVLLDKSLRIFQAKDIDL